MKKIITILGLFVLTSVVAGCSWTDRQIGPNDYEISGYFDFTMKGEVVVKGLEDQARLYCKGIDVYKRQAHHLDDQLETFLIQWMRGSGPAGLAAMPPLLRKDGCTIMRPLLGFQRTELERFARCV